METTKEETNYFLYGAVLSANLLSFSAGSAYSWTSPVLPKLHSLNPDVNPFKTPPTLLQDSCITSLLSFGAAFGPFLAGPLSTKIGRKKTLIAFTVPMMVAHLMLGFGKRAEVYMVARLLLGLGMGCSFSIVPNFVAEVAENHNRGLLGCLMGFMIACGSLFSYVVGPYVSIQNFSLINLIPLIIFNVSFGPFIPESPYFYVTVEDKVKAKNSLRRFRVNCSNDALDKELLSVVETVNLSKFNTVSGVKHMFSSKALKKGLFISIGLMVFQQFSGIGVVLAYLEIIVMSVGSQVPADTSAILIGLVAIFTIVLAAQLVDRLGKRNLLMVSTAGCFVSMTALGLFYFVKHLEYFKGSIESYTWIPMFSLVLYILTYNLALGPLPWTIMGEVFPPNMKNFASAIVTFICLFLSFLITTFYPLMAHSIGLAECFWLFGLSSAFGMVFVAICLPETRGKSLKEIQYMLEENTF